MVQFLARQPGVVATVLTPLWTSAPWWPLLVELAQDSLQLPPGALLPLAPDTVPVAAWSSMAWLVRT